jgi:hypothetical protein
MKKIFLMVLALVATNLSAQDLIDTFAKESCDCITGKKLDINNLKPGELKKEFLACFMVSYLAHADGVKTMGLNTDDEAAMEKFGQDVAFKMMNHCPDYLVKFGQDYLDESKAPETFSVDGEVVDIKSEQFVTIQLKDKNSRTYSFLLLDYFETASLFVDNKIGKKDKISISYREQELYDVKQKEFRYFKIITGLKKL